MARKQPARTARPSQAKDTEAREVQVKVTKSFDLWTINEEFGAPLTERVLALISGGFLEVTDHGTPQAGPGTTGTGDQGGEPQSAPAESSASPEPGQDFGSGGYGQAP